MHLEKIKKKWTLGGYAIFLQAYEQKLSSFLTDPSGYLKKHALPILKHCRPATLYQLSFNTESLVIKRFNYRGLGHWLLHMFRKTRAENCWHAAELLEKYGIKTAKPVALRVSHCLGLRYRSYYVYQLIEGPTLDQHIKQTQDYHLIDRAVAMIEKMHRHKITHGDLKASNLIVHDEDVYFVDLDVTRSHLLKNHERRDRDIRRFLKNWRDYPEILSRPAIQRLINTLNHEAPV